MRENISTLIQKLCWDENIDTQQSAINELVEIDEKDLLKLIQPIDKRYWDNAALVLKQIGYPNT